MATTAEPRSGARIDEPARSGGRTPPARSSSRSNWLLLIGLGAAVAAAVAIWQFQYGEADDSTGASVQTVDRGRLLVTITEDGNLESASNVEVKCQVAGGGTIISIIPDGTVVEEGQELVQLDKSMIEDQLNTQRIAYEKALAAKIQADQDYAAAVISVKEYAEGTYVKELQTVESTIRIAMENLRSAENTLGHTEKMYRKGFVTSLQLEADKFAVERSKLDLDSAQTAKKVLQEFTQPKMLKGLEATRDAADARRRSEDAAVKLEQAKLERLNDQLKFSVIKAPQRGMVVYANDMGRRGNSGQTATIEEGALVRERQTIIRLPDLTRMQVKVTVHESKVDLLHPGMAARVSLLDREWAGKVVSIANQPEAGGWMTSNIKEYATIVSIEGDTSGLKPGMTAEVEILIADLKDVLTVPVSSVVERNGKFFSWVRGSKGWDERPLLLGQTNDQVIEIKDGLKEGEQVILDPRAVLSEARQATSEEELAESQDRFGSATSAALAPEAGSASEAPPNAEVKSPEIAGNPEDAKDAPKKGGRGGGEGRQGRSGNRGNRRMPQFADMDKNGDKKITDDEIPEEMKGFLSRLDANADGAIDAAEMSAMQRRMEERRRQAREEGGGDAPRGGGPTDSVPGKAP